MVNISSYSNLYSHPQKYLEKHLVGSSKILESFLQEGNIDIVNKDLLSNIMKVTSLCHDLGKSTSYFQEYLLSDEKDKAKYKGMKETHHALISAVICFFAVNNLLNKYKVKDDERLLLSFISYIAVKKHHGNLDDIFDETIIDDDEITILKKQLDNIDMRKFSILANNLNKTGLKIVLEKETINNYIENINSELRHAKRLLRKITKKDDLTPYVFLNYVFSLLIDADKSEVVIGENIERRNIYLSPDIVENYKNTLSFKKNQINLLREEAYKEVNDKNIDLNKRILSINLPTGLGKTFTVMSFALRLRDKLLKEKGETYRIIYSLPFLSIIEQNADIFEKMLKANGINVESDILLQHHHLSDVKFKKSDIEYETDKSKIMIEGWNSEIIVTTFIQFFHTIISNKNSSLRKFHRIADSIIILDEVQSIPSHYWMLIRELLQAIVKDLNSYIIFVTATQPMIFKDNEIYSLVDSQKYFDKMDRVKIFPRLENMTLDEMANMFDMNDDRSYLFILNTISSALDFYKKLKDRFPDLNIIYMSTHVLPVERLERIKEIKEHKCRIAVTTQLVEAGVDIDFDVVVRDLAPLDSINQSAGRCNRNGENNGEVFVVSLIDDNGRKYSARIYDRVLINITEEILSKYKVIRENELLNIIEEYYKEVLNNQSSDKAKEILDAIYKLKYDSDDGSPCITKFALIENSYYKEDAFIELNDEAISLWQRYVELKEVKNLFARRNIFNEFKADFYKYTISIPTTIENMPAVVEGFRYVNHDSLRDYYDKETGFITKGTISLW